MEEEALREYAQDLGISIEEARAQWKAMDDEAEAFAKSKGISVEEAQTILARKEAQEIGILKKPN